MVQLKIVSGRPAGAVHELHRFPCLIGRSAEADVRLEEAGIWDRHLHIHLDSDRGFSAAILPEARATVNGQPLTRAPLRNGDVIEVGCVKLQFWLKPPRQSSLAARETMTWAALGLLCAGQVVLVYFLLQ